MNTEIKEIQFKPFAGGLIFVLMLGMTGVDTLLFVQRWFIPAGILLTIISIGLAGFVIINPNESRVLVLFGTYKGTILNNGFFWINPFFEKKKVSLRARNLNGTPVKVNDKMGNPIEIAAVVVWKVKETAKAVFEVDDYQQYVLVQCEAAIRHLAGSFPYDNIEEEHTGMTLRESTEEINQILIKELNERFSLAGIEVLEARLSHLAYASEIAGAMLQRQQAVAVVAARKQIVEGAVGMVELALDKLSEKKIVHLDEEKRAAMVSNLLVVLCSEKAATPVVNSGTLYH
jgi:regulator of protease activity HflC (stomatin/prohibitin superfamily)